VSCPLLGSIQGNIRVEAPVLLIEHVIFHKLQLTQGVRVKEVRLGVVFRPEPDQSPEAF
jgi:hypothetical protein